MFSLQACRRSLLLARSRRPFLFSAAYSTPPSATSPPSSSSPPSASSLPSASSPPSATSSTRADSYASDAFDADAYDADSSETLIGDLEGRPHVDAPPPTAGEQGFARQYTPSDTNAISDPIEIPTYRLHCHSTRNNTITTFTEPNGNTIAWYSGGSCGFKRGQRASYEAGYQCSVQIFKKIEEIASTRGIRLDLFFKGFGQGREAMQKALMTSEGENVRPLLYTITDRTPIKIGGTRAKKMRRL